MAKSSRSGWKSLLNSEPLSNMTLRQRGYLDSQTLSKSLDILAEVSSERGTSAILNQPVAGLIKVIQSRLKSHSLIVPSSAGCLILALIFV